ncbi:MAG TPA: hypothetical protein VGL42_00845 [Opitutaceae bacterium]|jgi:hypothetical protein
MKFLRYLFLAAGLLVVVAGLLLGAMLSPRLQTWALRRELQRKAAGSAVARLTVGFSDADVSQLILRRPGVVLTVPSLHAEFPTLAAVLDDRFLVSRLVAKGWTLDLSQMTRGGALAWLSETGIRPRGERARAFSLISTARASELAVEPAAFRGIFERLRLPFDLALGNADLEGDLILPPGMGAGPARIHVVANGGGLGAGQEGRFIFRLSATPPVPGPVSLVTAEGALSAAMDTPRSFTRLGIRLNAAAQGSNFPSEVRIVSDLGAQRSVDGESYSVVISSATKPLIAILADVPYAGQRPSGTWRLDLADEDVSPFLLGRQLPDFDLSGQGQADADPRGFDLHILGALRGTGDHLEIARPELAPIGAIGLSADFDVTRRGSLWRVDRLSAAVRSTGPIFNLRSLQPFAFDPESGAFQVADAAGSLFNVNLQEIPASWIQIFAPKLELTGGPLRGSFVGSAGAGGLTLRSVGALRFDDAALAIEGTSLGAGLSLESAVRASFAPAGWEMELTGLHVRLVRGEVANGSLRLGSRRGPDEPIKAESTLHFDLPVLAARAGQPAVLTGGSADLGVSGSWGTKRSVQLKLSVSGLAATTAGKFAPPAVTTQIRADWEPDAPIELHVPLTLTGPNRAPTVIAFDGAVGAGLTGPVVQGTISGAGLNSDDIAALGALFGGTHGHPGLATELKAGKKGWPWTGDFKLALNSGQWRKLTAANLKGEMRVNADGVSLDRLSGRLLGVAPFTATAAITQADDGTPSASWHAHVEAQNVEGQDFLGAIGVAHADILEGKFNVTANCSGTGENARAAIANTDAGCDLTSAGGHFKLLATVVTPKAVAGNLALDALRTVANTFESVIKRHKSEFANTVDATMYAAKFVGDIGYDQLSFRLTRSPNGDVWCRDFALISPDLRLQGQAIVTHLPGTKFSDAPLDAALELKARGKLADALKYLDVLESKPDDLGYRLCPLPIAVKGTLHHPDTSDLQATLLKLLEGKGADLLHGVSVK